MSDYFSNINFDTTYKTGNSSEKNYVTSKYVSRTYDYSENKRTFEDYVERQHFCLDDNGWLG